ncbi:MAG: ribosome maturation factor RimM [Bdellovibrionales bacterium]
MNQLKVGKVKAPHGIRGELFILIFSGDTSWKKKLKNAKIRDPFSDSSLSLTIKSSREHKEGLILSTLEVIDRNKAETLKGWDFYVDEELLKSNPGETIYLSEIMGFEVFLKEACVGIVQGVSSNGAQDLLMVRNEEHLFEIPFVKDFIVSLDFKNHKVMMDFPSELMELNKKS